MNSWEIYKIFQTFPFVWDEKQLLCHINQFVEKHTRILTELKLLGGKSLKTVLPTPICQKSAFQLLKICKICISKSMPFLLHFYVTIFNKMKIILRNIFKKFSVEKLWNFYHTKSAKTCTICIKICHFLSKEKICRLGQKSLQIFVKFSSARKIENLPFSEKSAELATLRIAVGTELYYRHQRNLEIS